jgi:hypothetical protein
LRIFSSQKIIANVAADMVKTSILSKQLLFNKKVAVTLWFGLSLIAVLLDYFHYKQVSNNYLIFRYVYNHMLQQVNLYLEYPKLYQDVNLYGPVFSVVMAPFAQLPDYVGETLWVMGNAAILFFAIRKLPVTEKWKNAIVILSAHEMMNAAGWFQSNPLIAACIILGWVYINEEKEIWALFFILLATFIKIYGIVGFAFLFFSKNKIRFIKWSIVWAAVFFFLPLLLAPFSFVIQSYKDWFAALQYKAHKNVRMDIHNDFQDISVMGMIRRIFNIPNLNDLVVLVPAIAIFGFQYVRFKYFNDLRYRYYLLCSVLIFTVIYSNGAESPTYIIAFPAVCFWFVVQPSSRSTMAVFIFALLLTSFSYSDIFTPYVRNHLIRPYSLKALPCFVVWLIIAWQIISKQFLQVQFDKARFLKPSTDVG